MIRGKTRHQLFLPHETSKRLAAIANSQKRARSDLLVEMVEAWLSKRAATDEAATDARRIERLQRSLDEMRRETFIVSHTLTLLVRHFLTRSTMWPAYTDEARAGGQKAHQQFLDSVARQIAKGAEVAASARAEEVGA